MAHVFMSYSRRDTAIVDNIAARLEKAGIDVWIDRGGIEAGKQWRAQIVEAIDGADAFVLNVSKNSIASVNVLKEVNLAEDAPDPFVLPVMLENVQLPAALRYQLAGVQQITYYIDAEKAYQELEATLKKRRSQLKKESQPKPEKREIEIVIKGRKIEDFDDAHKKQLLALLADVTGAQVNSLAITRIELGSLHVFVDAPLQAGYELKAHALNRDKRLAKLGIERLRFVGDSNFISTNGKLQHAERFTRREGRFRKAAIWSLTGILVLAALFIGFLGTAGRNRYLALFETATSTPTSTPTMSATATATPTHTATCTNTCTPTVTRTPTITLTPSPTPYDGPPKVRALKNSLCRSGPGVAYPSGPGDLLAGEEALILERFDAAPWFNVWVERHQVNCWVSGGDGGTVEVFGDLSAVPLVGSVAKPPSPGKPLPTVDMKTPVSP